MTKQELKNYLKKLFPIENESVEWKSWSSLKQNISGRKGEDVVSYISAISNVKGGHLIIGITDDFEVVGIKDLADYSLENIKPRVLGNCFNLSSEEFSIDEFIADDTEDRVWIFNIPKHLPRRPVVAHGKAWQRLGDTLIEMRSERHQAILDEVSVETDWSAQICSNASIENLDTIAITELKNKWSIKSARPDFKQFSDEKALSSLNLINEKGVTNTAILLLGKAEFIEKQLPNAEIIFEWRQDTSGIPHDFRKMWRKPFLLSYDEIWDAINARNIRVPFQEGLIQREVFAFHEKTIREALMNAVAHRDYTLIDRSIFIKASPQLFFIESPGSLPSGVTIENILGAHVWRNRRLMEVLEKIGLVERSGQGVDDIFRFTIIDGKGLPNLTASDSSSVRLKIPASIIDINFIKFLEQIVNEKQITLTVEVLFELERLREGEEPLDIDSVKKLVQSGIVEKFGKTRGMKYILSQRYYQQEKNLGKHTRLIGITRDAKKQLILSHIERNRSGGMDEFINAFPDIKKTDITNMLQELRREGKIIHSGATRGGKWVIAK